MPTALAYIGYVVGMRTTPVAVAGILTLVEPLTATLLGVAFFGDHLGTMGGAGALLLLASVATLALHSRARPAGE